MGLLWLQAPWAFLPIVAGPALADALTDRSRAVQLACSIALWATWAIVFAATVVPRSTSLTVVRAAGPGALAVAVAAAVAGPAGADDAFALGWAALVAAAALAPTTADLFADGSSYGDERRFVLRTPPSLLLGPVPLAWLLAVAAPAAAVVLLAAGAVLPGALAAAAALAGVRLGWPALHRLSRRWLVLVPAGLVVHDHIALPEPVLLRRSTLRHVRPAAADATSGEDVADLTLGAGGLVVEVAMTEPVELRDGDERRPVGRLLVSPLRPGAFLATAHERRLPG